MSGATFKESKKMMLIPKQEEDIRFALADAKLIDAGYICRDDNIFDHNIISDIVYHPTHGVIKKLKDMENVWQNFTQTLYNSIEASGAPDPGANFVHALVNPRTLLIEIAILSGWKNEAPEDKKYKCPACCDKGYYLAAPKHGETKSIHEICSCQNKKG